MITSLGFGDGGFVVVRTALGDFVGFGEPLAAGLDVGEFVGTALADGDELLPAPTVGVLWATVTGSSGPQAAAPARATMTTTQTDKIRRTAAHAKTIRRMRQGHR
ncbi:MAG: hypothetical protein HOU81_22415 [Hamadaea sp.]|uniref:hypothetical protein n=1 Tax=Hamadaea sp. TaxID=2024425 RepID=UPI0017DC4C37|nr:hypothetical protein [Hamadaea sp.]NUR73583.1 hypothetical protein [Hamadaea sp.]NUT18246.1 hypothetical protein [Hamadaea sp.]